MCECIHTSASPLLWDVLPTNKFNSFYDYHRRNKQRTNEEMCIWKKLVKLDQLSWFVVGTVEPNVTDSLSLSLLPKMCTKRMICKHISKSMILALPLSPLFFCHMHMYLFYKFIKWELCEIHHFANHSVAVIALFMSIHFAFSASSSSSSSRKSCSCNVKRIKYTFKREICHCN